MWLMAELRARETDKITQFEGAMLHGGFYSGKSFFMGGMFAMRQLSALFTVGKCFRFRQDFFQRGDIFGEVDEIG